MKQFYLTEIVTKDKLIHQGIFFRPKKPGKKAILWVHGLTSTFYGGVSIFEAFAETCEDKGIGFASFNNRGHDIVAGIKKIDPREPKGYTRVNGGAGYERFEDCVYDIDAGISFFLDNGYNEIVLAGHSTGANKTCYYAATCRDSRIVGIVLAGPMSDRFSNNTDKENYEKNFTHMQQLAKRGKGDDILNLYFFPMSAKRWLSLLGPNSKEDVFNYGDKEHVLIQFGKIRKPLLVLFSENDETADRGITAIKSIFDAHQKSVNYSSIIIPNTTHNYTGKEKEVVQTIVRWVSDI